MHWYSNCGSLKKCASKERKSRFFASMRWRHSAMFTYSWYSESESMFAVPTFCSSFCLFFVCILFIEFYKWPNQLIQFVRTSLKLCPKSKQQKNNNKNTAIKSHGFCFSIHICQYGFWCFDATHLTFQSFTYFAKTPNIFRINGSKRWYESNMK